MMKYLYFIWKNLTRKKVRTILTTLSIFVAFILFGLLSTLKDAFSLGAELAGADRLLTIHKISLIQLLPISYVNRIAAVEGVEAATHATWFGGYYQDQKNQFGQFPVEADAYLDLYTEIILSDKERQAWKNNQTGAVVGRALADRFNWKIGDRVSIFSTIFSKKDGSRSWEFDIEGIFDGKDTQTDTTYMMFHYKYFDESRQFAQGLVGWIGIKVADPQNSAQVAKDVDSLFANSPTETKTSTEKAFVESFAKQFGDIGTITTLVLSAVFFTMLLVAGNTMAQSVRERIPELAVMKTIGFSNFSVLNMVLAESLVIVLLGGILGMVIVYFLIGGLQVKVSAYLPGFAMTMATYFKALVLMFLMGLLAGIFPALQAMRLSIVNALGRH